MATRRTFWRRRGRWLLIVSLVLAVAASTSALLGPTGTEEEAQEAVREDTRPVAPVVETRSTTLLDRIRAGEEDAFVLVWLVVPIAIAAAPVALARTRHDVGARTVAATLLVAFALVTGFSIGLFYVPAALSMVAAAIVGRSRRPQAG